MSFLQFVFFTLSALLLPISCVRDAAAHESNGGGLEFITDSQKRSELVDQIKLIKTGPMSSWLHLLAGDKVAGNLGWGGETWKQCDPQPKQQIIPLSKILLWHPVRGPGERKAAGTKTTDRKNHMEAALRSNAITYSESEPFNHWNEVEMMDSTEDVTAIVIKHAPTIDREILHFQKKTPRPWGSTWGNIRSFRDMILQNDRGNYGITQLSYILAAGQGRLQAIKEAVNSTKINPNDFFVKVKVCEVPQRWGEAFLEIRRWYVNHDKFNDDRHRLPGMSEYEEVGHLISSRKSMMDTLWDRTDLWMFGDLWHSITSRDMSRLFRMFMDIDSYTAGNFMRADGADASIIFFAAERVSREMMAMQQTIMCIMQNFDCACEGECIEYQCHVMRSQCETRVDKCLEQENVANAAKREALMNTATAKAEFLQLMVKEIISIPNEFQASMKYPIVLIQKDQLFVQSNGLRLCDPMMEQWHKTIQESKKNGNPSFGGWD